MRRFLSRLRARLARALLLRRVRRVVRARLEAARRRRALERAPLIAAAIDAGVGGASVRLGDDPAWYLAPWATIRSWWPELAPLSRAERERVITRVGEILRRMR